MIFNLFIFDFSSIIVMEMSKNKSPFSKILKKKQKKTNVLFRFFYLLINFEKCKKFYKKKKFIIFDIYSFLL